MKVLIDNNEAVVGYCERCKQKYCCRKRDDRPEPKYGKIYRRDTLQPSRNLYYKEYGKMNIV